jgi:hypothetical protein
MQRRRAIDATEAVPTLPVGVSFTGANERLAVAVAVPPFASVIT